MKKYVVKYGVLPSGSVSDKILVINPEYGEKVGKYGSRPIHKLNNTKEFIDNLEKSVLSEGFRHPIVCFSIEEGLFCQYGSNRLYVAKKNKLDIPIIILDYVNKYDDLLDLNVHDIQDMYGKDHIINITEDLVEVRLAS